jgi:translation initiation factor IF-3
MHNRFAILLVVMMLVVTTAAFAQTAVDVTGRVVRVDPGAQLIILDNNQAFRVTPNTMLFVDNRPVTLGTVQPGQAVMIRSGEAVAVVPSAPAPVVAQAPGTTTVITSPSASPGLSQQTIYGQITEVDSGKVKVKTADDDFNVKVPREVAAQLRKGDSVRLDVTFQPTR